NGGFNINGQMTASLLTLKSTANNGSILLNKNVIGTTSVNLTANGTGNISQTYGTVQSPIVAFASGTGSIGTQTSLINTIASTLSANTAGTGTVYVNNTGAVSLLGSTAGGAFYLLNNGNITVNGAVSGNTVTLISQPGNGSITLNASVSGS